MHVGKWETPFYIKRVENQCDGCVKFEFNDISLQTKNDSQ